MEAKNEGASKIGSLLVSTTGEFTIRPQIPVKKDLPEDARSCIIKRQLIFRFNRRADHSGKKRWEYAKI